MYDADVLDKTLLNHEKLITMYEDTERVRRTVALAGYEEAYKIHARLHPQRTHAEHEEFAKYAMTIIAGRK